MINLNGFSNLILSAVMAVMLLSISAPSTAITFKEAPKKLEELEQEYDQVLKQLEKLKQRLDHVIREDATLKERGDYIREIWVLRGQLKKLEAAREELGRSVGELPQAPPVLKLVKITQKTGSEAEGRGAGFVIRNLLEVEVGLDGERGLVKEALSFRITQAPLQIFPNEPFSISAELNGRRHYPANHVCADYYRAPRSEDQSAMHMQISAKELFGSVSGKPLRSACGDENFVFEEGVSYTKDATVVGDTVKLKMDFQPTEKRVEGEKQIYYYDATVSGRGKTRATTKRHVPFFTFDLPTDAQGYVLDDADILGRAGINGVEIFMGAAGKGGIILHYEPVRKTDRAMTTLNVPNHPADATEPLIEGAVSSLHTMPYVEELPVREALEKIRKRQLSYQLQAGRPANNAEEDGKVQSQSIKAGRPISENDKVIITVFSPYVATQTVPDVRHMDSGKAKELLEAAGFQKITVGPGKPAPTAQDSLKVESTNPPPNSKIDLASEVELLIFSPYIQEIIVPHLLGMTTTKAKAALARLGLKHEFASRGSVAQRADQAGTVERQEPQPKVKVSSGSIVNLILYRPTRDQQIASKDCSNVPNTQPVWDRNQQEAMCQCVDGFRSNQGGGCSPTRQTQITQHRCPSNAFADWDNRINAPNCYCKRGYEMKGGRCVRVLSPDEQVAQHHCGANEYADWDSQANTPYCRCKRGFRAQGNQCVRVLTPQEQVARHQCSSNSYAAWDNQRNAPQCFCNRGYQWNGNACVRVLTPQEQVARHQCPGNSYAAWDNQRNAPQCFCNRGYQWNGNACVRVLTPQEQVARYDCSNIANSYAKWDNRSGGPLCFCRSGYQLNAQKNACIRKTQQARCTGRNYWDYSTNSCKPLRLPTFNTGGSRSPSDDRPPPGLGVFGQD